MSVRVALFARFPSLRGQFVSWPLIPEFVRDRYPELAADFAVLDVEVAPAFAEHDKVALRDLTSYRRQQVTLILEATLLAVLGGLQVFFPHQRWPSVLIALLGVLFALGTIFPRDSASEATSMAARLKAERLRSLYFAYLSATARYAGPDRVHNLRLDVVAILRGEEPE
jgi:hypothetical protein